MRTVLYDRGDVRLSVFIIGEGPTMVFQHGLGGDASQPAAVFPAEIEGRCVVIECRGHGQSEAGPAEAFSIVSFADDVSAWIDDHEPAPIVLGGISMGAAIALRLAVLRPARIRALVLARPAWIDERAPSNMQPYAMVAELLSRYSPDEARLRFENSETGRRLASEAPDNLASLLGFFSRQPISTTRELLRRISADGTDVSRAEIGRIRQPALIIGTARDFVHPMAKAEELAGLMPNATMVEITSKSDSRDAYQRDFQAALAAFLQRV